MKFVRPPYAVRKLYSSLLWRVPTTEKKIYLTFDDGPIPEVTPWVLDVLKKHTAKATFFCIGQNVEKNPVIYKQILDERHAVGNHTYDHLNGWKTRDSEYFNNIEKCSGVMTPSPSERAGMSTEAKAKVEVRTLFRPPYGKIKKSQISYLQSHCSLIMWDLLSYDYDQSVTPEKCLSNVIRYARQGSIIVFHDSLKAQKNLEYVLPKALVQLSKKGYSFDALK